MRVFLELDGTRRKVQALAADRNGILPTRGGFVRQGPDTILISEPPERWTQLWVPTRSGRVAHANRTWAPAEATAWLPDRPLPPVRLEDLHEENGQPRSGRIQYQLRLFHDTGRYGTVAPILDSFEFDSTTSEWPIWSKREPIGMEGHFPVLKLMGTEEPSLRCPKNVRWGAVGI